MFTRVARLHHVQDDFILLFSQCFMEHCAKLLGLFLFFEGKFYMVSKELSIFIGGQEKLAKELSNNFPVEDLMVGYLSNEFKSISSISK